MRQLAEGINALGARTPEACSGVACVIAGLARGDLGHTVEGHYEGIFAAVQGDVNHTIGTLRDVAARLGDSAAAVQTAAAEISEGSHNLATRTESQASTLEQTAAAMHQITATVKQNADNAQAARQLAHAARGHPQTAARGVAQASGRA